MTVACTLCVGSYHPRLSLAPMTVMLCVSVLVLELLLLLLLLLLSPESSSFQLQTKHIHTLQTR